MTGELDLAVDVVVVGAGLAGAAAAWELTRRGYSVLVLEQFARGHDRGSSHGSSRIYRRAYADPFYVALTGRASERWDLLEEKAGRSFRTRTGGLDVGHRRDPASLATVLSEAGVDARLLAPEEVAERWPGLRVDGPALFHADAGHLDPDAAIGAMLDLAVARGARVREQTALTRLEPGPGGVLVEWSGGAARAGGVVVAVGAWLPDLLGGLGVDVPLPALRVKQQEVFHFRQLDPAVRYPTVVHKADVEIYGLPSGRDGGPEPAMKLGQVDSDTTTTARTRDRVIDPRARRVVVDHVRRHLPGLAPDPVAEQSCLFTMAADEDFVIDRVGDVVIASPCSGHGAKFAPLVGSLVADLVEGGRAEPRFAFRGAPRNVGPTRPPSPEATGHPTSGPMPMPVAVAGGGGR